jgi:hypothetical protein
MYTNDDAKKEVAFDTWVAHIPTRMLECRVNHHQFADWSDRKNAAWRKSRLTKVITVEVPCRRKCGTTLTKFLDEDGNYSRSNIVRHYYDPEYGYLMPKDARGPGLTKERRTKFRRELIERNNEYITEI